jgi:Zn-finger nucleic acid-binding protein
MKCPACFGELKEIQVGSLKVDACFGGCGGVWFDAFELQRVDEEAEREGTSLLDLQRDEQLAVDFTRKRECPRCPDIKLKRHFFSARRQVEVDQCPNCNGYWLDYGELALIRAERSEQARAAGKPQGFSVETIRYVYRLSIQSRPTP